MSKDMRSKRSAFCCWYAALGDPEEAAVRAGFDSKTALSDGIACLRSAECRRKIAELRTLLADGGSVIAGLKRLAFGNCKDAVCLAFAEEMPPPSIIAGLDLFNVSEIKRVKGGGVEIKLFDRMKALEKLYELENAFDHRDKAEGLIAALTASAETDGEADTVDD